MSANYKAILRDKRIYVQDAATSKLLYNCVTLFAFNFSNHWAFQIKYFLKNEQGYFGKGEYSRGEPLLNKTTSQHETVRNLFLDNQHEHDEFSLSMQNVSSISAETFNNKKTWSQHFINKNNNSEPDLTNRDFNSKFLREFVKSNVNLKTTNEYLSNRLNSFKPIKLGILF